MKYKNVILSGGNKMEIREYDVWVENACGDGFYHIEVFATSEEDAEKEAERYLLSGETILGIDEC